MDAGHRVAIVCSARSGETKETGTTNMLLRAAVEALQPPIPDPAVTRSTTNVRPTTPGSNRSEGPNPLVLSQILQRGGMTSPRLSRTYSNTPAGCDTPTLLSGYNSVGNGQELNGLNPSRFDQTIEQIKLDHLQAARQLITTNLELLNELELDLIYDCDRLRSFLLAAQVCSFFFLFFFGDHVYR